MKCNINNDNDFRTFDFNDGRAGVGGNFTMRFGDGGIEVAGDQPVSIDGNFVAPGGVVDDRIEFGDMDL